MPVGAPNILPVYGAESIYNTVVQPTNSISFNVVIKNDDDLISENSDSLVIKDNMTLIISENSLSSAMTTEVIAPDCKCMNAYTCPDNFTSIVCINYDECSTCMMGMCTRN